MFGVLATKGVQNKLPNPGAMCKVAVQAVPMTGRDVTSGMIDIE